MTLLSFVVKVIFKQLLCLTFPLPTKWVFGRKMKESPWLLVKSRHTFQSFSLKTQQTKHKKRSGMTQVFKNYTLKQIDF